MDEAKARLLIQRIDASIEMLNQTKQDILDFLGNDSLAQIKELEENEDLDIFILFSYLILLYCYIIKTDNYQLIIIYNIYFFCFFFIFWHF